MFGTNNFTVGYVKHVNRNYFYTIFLFLLLIVEVIALVNIFLYPSPITSESGSQNDNGSGLQEVSSPTVQLNNEINTQVQQSQNFKTLAEANQLLKNTFTGFLKTEGRNDNPSVGYFYSNSGSSVAFASSKIMFSQRISTNGVKNNPVQFNITFSGSNLVKPIGVSKLPQLTNYFLGSVHETNIPSFNEVWYYNIYPHIDLRYFMTSNGLKYEFLVNPGGNPSLIHVQVTDNVKLTTTTTAVNFYSSAYPTQRIMSDSGLQVYQNNGVVVPSSFKLSSASSSNVYSFHISSYDQSKVLTIDPSLLGFSTYLGGKGDEISTDVAIDTAGNIYVTGTTNSTDFPVYNAYNSTFGGSNATSSGYDLGGDIFITKFNPTGNLVFSTFLGGSESEISQGLALDSNNNIFVTGITYSKNFPLYNAYNSSWYYQDDSFITKLNSAGNALVFSTFTGEGSTGWIPGAKLISTDTNGNAYIVNNLNVDTKFFVNKYNTIGSRISNRIIIGTVDLHSIAVTSGGTALYIVGSTYDNNALFITNNAFNHIYGGNGDGFILKLDLTSGNPVYGAYLGGNVYDTILSVAIDNQGNAYVTGFTQGGDFPITTGALSDKFAGGTTDVFVAKISSDGSKLLFSTFLGGSGNDQSFSITLDSKNNIYITGGTSSSDFPTKNAYDSIWKGGNPFGFDAFVTKLNPEGNAIIFSTFLGGLGDDDGTAIVVDSNGASYLTGATSSSDFPLQNPYQTTYEGGYSHGFDVFVSKLLSPTIPAPTISLFSPTNNSVDKTGTLVSFNISSPSLGIQSVTYSWDSGNNASFSSPYELSLTGSEGVHILHVYATDFASNTTTMDYDFIVDNTAPTISLLSPSNSAIKPSGTEIKLNITDQNGVAKVYYEWDNSSKNITLSSPYSIALISGNGLHILQIFAVDNAGNTAIVSYQFTTKDSSSTQLLNNVLTIIGTLIAIAIPVSGFIYWRSLSLRYRKLIKDYVINDMSIEDLSTKYHKSHRQIEEILRKTKKMS